MRGPKHPDEEKRWEKITTHLKTEDTLYASYLDGWVSEESPKVVIGTVRFINGKLHYAASKSYQITSIPFIKPPVLITWAEVPK